MAKKHIEESWETYRKMVVPAEAGEAQVTDMRDAFFAGAMSLYATLMSELDGTEKDCEPTDDDMDMMERISQELQDYAAQRVLDTSVFTGKH